MKINFISSSSILKKFLIFNFIVFVVLGLFTFLYLKEIEPNLVKKRSSQHLKVINNTSENINRLNIQFTKENMTKFLLDNRFLFQNLDRVQFYDLQSNLLADTNTLDLAQNISVQNKNVLESAIDKVEESIALTNSPEINKSINFNTKNYVKVYSEQNNQSNKSIISDTINNNFYVITINLVREEEESKGYIVVSEIANDILVAVKERNNLF